MSCEVIVNQTKLALVLGDITKQETDAIVNAANPSLRGGGGVDGAIHRAGGGAILDACKAIIKREGRLPTGKAVITTGGNLHAKYVIHTVGPIWQGGTHNEAELLTSAYQESLRVATHYKLGSISFPSISTGAYGFPVEKAAPIALNAVVSFLTNETTSLKEVVFVLFDARTYKHYRAAFETVTAEAV
jgi:O-acetyl-ADP-ribose deacetylase (regulator of RNase III)